MARRVDTDCLPAYYGLLTYQLFTLANKKTPHLYVGSFYLSLINTVRTRLELVISSVTGMRPKPTRPTDQLDNK